MPATRPGSSDPRERSAPSRTTLPRSRSSPRSGARSLPAGVGGRPHEPPALQSSAGSASTATGAGTPRSATSRRSPSNRDQLRWPSHPTPRDLPPAAPPALKARSGVVALLRADAGQTLGFARVVARKPEETGDGGGRISLRASPVAEPGVLAERLTLPQYPRSAAYDPAWVMANVMGPHPLWLMEWLTGAMRLEPGMRVLDLGCGTALTSVFLAREFGVQVTAADLWITPGDNWRRVREAGTGAGSVTPLSVEAHELPFADGYFDAIVSVDAYHYFGTDVRYLPTLARCVRPGGQIAMAAPGTRVDLDAEPVPEHLSPWAADADFWTFRTAQWWHRAWERSGMVTVETADALEDGWREWLLWNRTCAEFADPEWTSGPARKDPIVADSGRVLTLTRVVASRD